MRNWEDLHLLSNVNDIKSFFKDCFCIENWICPENIIEIMKLYNKHVPIL